MVCTTIKLSFWYPFAKWVTTWLCLPPTSRFYFRAAVALCSIYVLIIETIIMFTDMKILAKLLPTRNSAPVNRDTIKLREISWIRRLKFYLPPEIGSKRLSELIIRTRPHNIRATNLRTCVRALNQLVGVLKSSWDVTQFTCYHFCFRSTRIRSRSSRSSHRSRAKAKQRPIGRAATLEARWSSAAIT